MRSLELHLHHLFGQRNVLQALVVLETISVVVALDVIWVVVVNRSMTWVDSLPVMAEALMKVAFVRIAAQHRFD